MAGNKAIGTDCQKHCTRIIERILMPNLYRVGEVCQIVAKDNPDLQGKGGRWCTVSLVNDFSCTVAWDGEHTVKLEHLKSLEYSDDDCVRMKEVCDRMNRLNNSGKLERLAYVMLKKLGEVERPYLTTFEEKILGFLEHEFRECL